MTSRAHADFSDNTAEGHDPIEGHGPSGDIWGQGFRVLDKGDTIIFTGRSHAILKSSEAGQGDEAAPALARPRSPRTAAQIEAAASPSPHRDAPSVHAAVVRRRLR